MCANAKGRTMTTTVSTTQLQLALLDDRFAITDLIYSLGAALDEHRFDDLRDLFIEDATASTPGGIAQGRDAVIAQATRNHLKYSRLQHSITNLLIDLNGDRAVVRANLHAAFAGETGVPDLMLGAVYRFQAQRTEQRWRLAGLEVTPIWRQSTE
jgi:ketosteroid isomerase-like protein